VGKTCYIENALLPFLNETYVNRSPREFLRDKISFIYIPQPDILENDLIDESTFFSKESDSRMLKQFILLTKYIEMLISYYLYAKKTKYTIVFFVIEGGISSGYQLYNADLNDRSYRRLKKFLDPFLPKHDIIDINIVLKGPTQYITENIIRRNKSGEMELYGNHRVRMLCFVFEKMFARNNNNNNNNNDDDDDDDDDNDDDSNDKNDDEKFIHLNMSLNMIVTDKHWIDLKNKIDNIIFNKQSNDFLGNYLKNYLGLFNNTTTATFDDNMYQMVN